MSAVFQERTRDRSDTDARPKRHRDWSAHATWGKKMYSCMICQNRNSSTARRFIYFGRAAPCCGFDSSFSSYQKLHFFDDISGNFAQRFPSIFWKKDLAGFFWLFFFHQNFLPMSSSVAFWAQTQNLMTNLSLTEAGTMWSRPEALMVDNSFWFNVSEPRSRKQTRPSWKLESSPNIVLKSL